MTRARESGSLERAGAGALSRRSVLHGAAGLVGVAALDSQAGARAAARPNIVFIMADDLGAFDLSCYGRPDYRTPRIDSLARDGMLFRFGYSSSATCTPTRVGLISGRYPNRVPVGTVAGGGATSGTVGYRPEWPSLARTLRSAGYRTALVGKWNLGPLPNFSPLKSGYDEFFGFTGGAIDYFSHDNSGNPFVAGTKRKPDFYDGESPVTVDGYSTDLFTDRACALIDRNRSRPFMLSLHYSAPHWPWQTRSVRAEGRVNDANYDGGSMRLYGEMMAALDEGVGRVIDRLDYYGLGRDTLVVFTSDNGGERFSYMWPLRGQKGSLLEGGVRVPLLVRWPGHIGKGSRTDQIAVSMDWLPTLAAVAGAIPDVASPPDGLDLSPQLFGKRPADRMVFWKTPDGQSALAYPWKYLKEDGVEFLFNLEQDESENANFKRSRPEVFARLQAASREWAAGMSESPPGSGRTGDWLRGLDAPPRNP